MSKREIKFRAWNKKFSGWDIVTSTEGDFNELFNNKNFIFQEYTGLKDKNGKEIYEGDIVKFARTRIETIEESPRIFKSKLIELGDDIGEIVYMGFSFCLSFDHKRYDDIETMGNYSNRFEVIGNIFETPELLNP